MGRAQCKHKGSVQGHQLDKVLNFSMPQFPSLQNGYSGPPPPLTCGLVEPNAIKGMNCLGVFSFLILCALKQQ